MSDLHVTITGSGPAVLLLHAFPCDGGLWEAQAAALAEAGYHVIVPDLPGFGRSALPSAEPSLDSLGAVILEHLDEVGVTECIVAGSSVGGYLAAAILRSRLSLVAGLIMVGTKATADSDEARANRLRLADLVVAESESTGRILEQSVVPNLLGPTSWASRPQVAARVRAWADGARAETVAWYQRAMASRPDSVGDLASLAVPALVVWGPEDALSPRSEQDVMLAALADGRLTEVPQAGHLCTIEQPDVVAAAMVGFADAVTGRRTAG